MERFEQLTDDQEHEIEAIAELIEHAKNELMRARKDIIEMREMVEALSAKIRAIDSGG